MSVTFLNEHNVCRFGQLRMWAERGLIHVERASDGMYRVVQVKNMLHRIKAMSDMIRNSLDEDRKAISKMNDAEKLTLEDHQRMVDKMIVICQQAKEQGMPDDPSARSSILNARPKTFQMTTPKGVM